MYFNPRSREGSDRIRAGCSLEPPNFNPRSREGSDRPAGSAGHTRTDFNPRSREGSDWTDCRWRG